MQQLRRAGTMSGQGHLPTAGIDPTANGGLGPTALGLDALSGGVVRAWRRGRLRRMGSRGAVAVTRHAPRAHEGPARPTETDVGRKRCSTLPTGHRPVLSVGTPSQDAAIAKFQRTLSSRPVRIFDSGSGLQSWNFQRRSRLYTLARSQAKRSKMRPEIGWRAGASVDTSTSGLHR